MRTCKTCKIEKDLSAFGKCASRPTGLKDSCKECLNARSAQWRLKNPERFRELNNRWHKNNPEANRKRVREWARNNPERKAESDKAYVAANREMVREQGKNYRVQNSAKISAHKKAYRLANLEEIRAKNRDWQKANPGKTAANGARRAARKRQACPKWLTREQHLQMRNMYEAAALMSLLTGVKHHVDHIIPLGGKTVCGLHVPWNLQVLTAEENIKKGAK